MKGERRIPLTKEEIERRMQERADAVAARVRALEKASQSTQETMNLTFAAPGECRNNL